jgi:hypothetical protein
MTMVMVATAMDMEMTAMITPMTLLQRYSRFCILRFSLIQSSH